MGDVIKLESDNPHSWGVEDALERALENIKNGKFKADMVYVALSKAPENGEKYGRIYYTMAGMQLPEAVGWLTIHRNALMDSDDD